MKIPGFKLNAIRLNQCFQLFLLRGTLTWFFGNPIRIRLKLYFFPRYFRFSHCYLVSEYQTAKTKTANNAGRLFSLGVVHKRRHAFFDNSWHPLPPLSIFAAEYSFGCVLNDFLSLQTKLVAKFILVQHIHTHEVFKNIQLHSYTILQCPRVPRHTGWESLV